MADRSRDRGPERTQPVSHLRLRPTYPPAAGRVPIDLNPPADGRARAGTAARPEERSDPAASGPGGLAGRGRAGQGRAGADPWTRDDSWPTN